MCDYDVDPDHAGYPQARPKDIATFRDMWGSLCLTEGPALEFTDILHIAVTT